MNSHHCGTVVPTIFLCGTTSRDQINVLHLSVKVLKPMVEKKRRDRINQSLAELRGLLLSHTCDPVSRVRKISLSVCKDKCLRTFLTLFDAVAVAES